MLTKLLQIYIKNSEYLKSAGLTQKNKSIVHWRDLFNQSNSAIILDELSRKLSAILVDGMERVSRSRSKTPVHAEMRCSPSVAASRHGSWVLGVIDWFPLPQNHTQVIWEPLVTELLAQLTMLPTGVTFRADWDRYRKILQMKLTVDIPVSSILTPLLDFNNSCLFDTAGANSLLVQPYVESIIRVFDMVAELPVKAEAKIAENKARLDAEYQAAAYPVFVTSVYSSTDFVPARVIPTVVYD